MVRRPGPRRRVRTARHLNVVDPDPADCVAFLELKDGTFRAGRHGYAGLIHLPRTAISPIKEIIGAVGPWDRFAQIVDEEKHGGRATRSTETHTAYRHRHVKPLELSNWNGNAGQGV